MSDQVIDKPPISTEPPELPPYLRGKRWPGRRIVIIPHISMLTYSEMIRDHKNNWITVIYSWMARWDLENGHYEVAHSHSRRYKNWLETYDLKEHGGVSPHISFGGCITPGDGDLTFHPRWVEFAKKEFV